ncbi:hypothetical protein DXG03_006136 [Asterophora parasitica]|uniref:ATP-dependent DNA helicase n=1 Tax=Asterophora parasitica TaxID=117018 RepID=A0A9P7KHX5_9AGAR|nr:hypothetical protein DXG03_006136 [Asterophora parasitica]
MKLVPDLLEAKHWIYPLNRPKRDYQYNIVKHCLFDNTIVALPTGLGKTFIAGVIMLNCNVELYIVSAPYSTRRIDYRWFPEGKIVFVAPTKPLVAQQIEACHQTCGIPGIDAAELTGQTARTVRGRLDAFTSTTSQWREKRVFYMTPQTLVNDLTSENCDVRDVVLLVIDEAHRATGDYAYNQVVRFLMAKNPHFRILALTATPGGNPDAVQNLIDGLHISHIEIRDENSLDLKQYIHYKKIEQHIIGMSDEVNRVRDLLAALMDKDLKPLKQRGVMWGSPDPVKLHPYSAQARMSKLEKDQRWAYAPLSRLSSLARAMGYLIEGTLGMCHTYMHDLGRAGEEEEAATGAAKTAASRKKSMRDDPMFQAVLRELDTQRAQGFSIHPKMDRLKTLVIEHFGQQMGDGTTPDETRVMVFVTFREAVDEIVEALNCERPLIRAHKFIGQGTDKQGKKGLAQKDQLDVIQRFKEGEFNVLVATSIGEEGLDIGEVDLIVCYDAQKTPIRMLQRLGRTGRKRAGVVHVLLAEHREEMNLDKAKDTYKEVQKTIVRGEQLELYSDVPRLLPDHIKPACLEKAMEIQEYVREDGRKKTTKEPRASTAGTKRKRNDDVSRNIPVGASTGFVSVADLLVKGAKKQKKAEPAAKKDFDIAGEDDDTDMDIESGVVSAIPRRTKSAVPSSSSSKKSDKSSLRRAKTSASKGTKKKAKVVDPASSQFSSKGVDDSDDMDIERGLVASPRSKSPSSPSPEPSRSRVHTASCSPGSSTHAVIDLSDSDDHRGTCNKPSLFVVLILLLSSEPPPETVSNDGDQSMAWLVDDDEDPKLEIVDSSPIASRIRRLSPRPDDSIHESKADKSIDFLAMTRRSGERPLLPCLGPVDADSSIEFVGAVNGRHTSDVLELSDTSPDSARNKAADESIEFVAASSIARTNLPSSPLWPESSSPVKPIRGQTRGAEMPSPRILPRGPILSSPEKEHEFPEPSFPVRPLVKPRRRVIVESPGLDVTMPSPPQRRLHRRASPQPQARQMRKQGGDRRPDANFLFDFEAAHSGDEVSEGSSGPEDEENESDRSFLRPLPETQVSPSYDQTLAYRQSLFTQAPMGRGPAFANGPVRSGIFGAGLRARPRLMVSSSPPREDDDAPDEYVMGSFVVDDDADISYISDD